MPRPSNPTRRSGGHGARRAHPATSSIAEARLQPTTTSKFRALVRLDTACFAPAKLDSDELTGRIVVDLLGSGVAAPPSAILGGGAVIRAAIANHRAAEADLEVLSGERDRSVRLARIAPVVRAQLFSGNPSPSPPIGHGKANCSAATAPMMKSRR